jgi:hypothetical protein
VIDYPGDTPGRGGWHRNEQGLALVRHPAGVRKLAYGGASSIWPFDPYNGPAIYGDRGTFLHSICDYADAGEPLPPAFIAAGVALDISADLQAYIYARYIVFLKAHGLTVTHVEVPVVVDRAKVATNIDRVVTCGGVSYVADIKSSSKVESPGYLLQLALAAESTPYDQTADERILVGHRIQFLQSLDLHAHLVHDPKLGHVADQANVKSRRHGARREL